MIDTDAAAETQIAVLEAKYPRATRLGLSLIDRGFRWINLGFTAIGIATVLRWIIF